ncbi:uncharacterized protein LOC133376359 [Rhineura floridana]|uniref:uncharacterized protein LOC133376359 n=1 Tax=Rhineura floridana TaxID=261503 RepID=UPI002AC8889B|nr:uncharacterized protein LOC133376359 [Rhineura floridana]
MPTLALVTTAFVSPVSVSVPPQELKRWTELGAILKQQLWTMPDGRACLPRALYQTAAKWFHDHGGPYGTHALVDSITRFWYAPGIQPVCGAIVKACHICQANGPALPNRAPQGGRPVPAAPFLHIQIDFVDLPKAEGKKHLLVMVCPLTAWIEAFPTTNATATTVAKLLLKEIIPRFGVPEVIDSDRGTHFTGQILAKVEEGLGIKHLFHTVYHPQSSGATERQNREIKTALAKYTQETGLRWPQNRIRELWKTAGLTKTVPLEDQVHPFRPGDFVWAKKFVRGDSLQPRYTGLHQVLLSTQAAVFLEGRKSWIHHSHVKPVVVAAAPPPRVPKIRLQRNEETGQWQAAQLPFQDADIE